MSKMTIKKTINKIKINGDSKTKTLDELITDLKKLYISIEKSKKEVFVR